MQDDPIKPTLKAPGIKLLKLKYDKPLSNVAFTFNLRRYSLDSEFLNALPPDLREELLATNRAIARLNTEGGGGGGRGGQQLEAIDPSFLAALPPDMQAEVVHQQAGAYTRPLFGST